MPNPFEKKIWVTWSGGVDSTALVGHLLKAGFEVHPVTFLFGPRAFRESEERARRNLCMYFEKAFPHQFKNIKLVNANFLELFSPDGGAEVPRRNKHFMDYIMMQFVVPNDGYYIGLGSYIGADTAAADHLHGMDTDSRYLSSYLLSEYGIGYQLMSMADFGPSRYKTDQIKQLMEAVPWEYGMATYNCMIGVPGYPELHCGRCYKCVERAAAFNYLYGRGKDTTKYETNPTLLPYYREYIEHFKGNHISLSWDRIKIGNQGSHRED